MKNMVVYELERLKRIITKILELDVCIYLSLGIDDGDLCDEKVTLNAYVLMRLRILNYIAKSFRMEIDVYQYWILPFHRAVFMRVTYLFNPASIRSFADKCNTTIAIKMTTYWSHKYTLCLSPIMHRKTPSGRPKACVGVIILHYKDSRLHIQAMNEVVSEMDPMYATPPECSYGLAWKILEKVLSAFDVPLRPRPEDLDMYYEDKREVLWTTKNMMRTLFSTIQMLSTHVHMRSKMEPLAKYIKTEIFDFITQTRDYIVSYNGRGFHGKPISIVDIVSGFVISYPLANKSLMDLIPSMVKMEHILEGVFPLAIDKDEYYNSLIRLTQWDHFEYIFDNLVYSNPDTDKFHMYEFNAQNKGMGQPNTARFLEIIDDSDFPDHYIRRTLGNERNWTHVHLRDMIELFTYIICYYC